MVEKELKILAKGAGIFLFGMITTKILGYLYRLIVARYLGPEEYGLLNLGFAVIGILTAFAVFGLPSGVLRYVAYFKGKSDNSRLKGVIISSLKISLPLSIFLAIILFVLSDIISINLFHNPALSPIIKILSIALPLFSIISILESVSQAMQLIKYNVLIRNISESAIQLILTIILILLGYGIFGAVIGHVVAVFTSAVFFIIVIHKKVFPFLDKHIKTTNTYKELILFSWPLIFVYIFGRLQNWIDSISIGIFKSASYVGLYNAAIPTSQLLMILPATVGALFIPTITQLYAQNKSNEINKLYYITNKWAFLMNFPVFLLLIIFSKQILNILFGQQYTEAYMAMIILCIGYFLYSMIQLSSGVLQSVKKTKVLMMNTLVFSILNILLNFALIPKYGIEGAAIATSISLILLSVLFLIEVHKFEKLNFLKFVLLKSVLSSVIAAIFIYLVKDQIFKNNLILNFVSLSVIFFVIYIVLLFLTKSIEQEDKKLFADLLSFLRRRIT